LEGPSKKFRNHSGGQTLVNIRHAPAESDTAERWDGMEYAPRSRNLIYGGCSMTGVFVLDNLGL
jgi:hypothetical protein